MKNTEFVPSRSFVPACSDGMTAAEIGSAVEETLRPFAGRAKKILIIGPDYTRFHSRAGEISAEIYRLFPDAQIRVLEALGTHVPMTREECASMYPAVPFADFLPHRWKEDTVKVGEIAAQEVRELSGGLLDVDVPIEINREILADYDLIVSVGQVVPHEMVGMSNQSKNIFVGCGGPDTINYSHILAAYSGVEKIMGKDHSSVRRLFDLAASRFLSGLPLVYIMTVSTADEIGVHTYGIYSGSGREAFEAAVAKSQEKNITHTGEPVETMIVKLDPAEFKSTWLGNKAVYRTRKAIADGGELVILAAGVERFGEDEEIDRYIRRYGYTGTDELVRQCADPEGLGGSLATASHLIESSSDGRFTITYCVKKITRAEIESVNYAWASYDEAAARYELDTLRPGWNFLSGGEKVYYVENPALGLWEI